MTAGRETIARRTLFAVLVLSLGAIAALLVLQPGLGAETTGASAPRTALSIGPQGFAGPVLPAGLRAPGFRLADESGRRVSLGDLRGHALVVSFIHSRCYGTCPLAIETIKGAVDQLPSAAAHSVRVLAITVAPAEDTPASRRRFLRAHRMLGRMAYLSGDRAELSRVWASWHVLPEPPHGATDAHSTFTFLVDRAGIERVGFPDQQMTPEALAHDLGRIAR